MRIINFFLYLAVYAGLIAGGGVLMALGSTAAYNSYKMFQVVQEHADTIALAQPENAPMSGAELVVAAGLMPWLFIAGELLIGLVLMFFGVRGLVRRLAQGLPPPEKAAETPQGRIWHALAYGAGAVAGSLLLVSSLINNADHLIPKLMGETTTAKIIRSETTQDRAGYHSRLAYQFSLADGSILQYEKEVPRSFVRKHERGTEIEIRYMPGNPGRHMFPSEKSYNEFVVRLGICLVVVVVGFAGVNRNLSFAEAA